MNHQLRIQSNNFQWSTDQMQRMEGGRRGRRGRVVAGRGPGSEAVGLKPRLVHHRPAYQNISRRTIYSDKTNRFKDLNFNWFWRKIVKFINSKPPKGTTSATNIPIGSSDQPIRKLHFSQRTIFICWTTTSAMMKRWLHVNYQRFND